MVRISLCMIVRDEENVLERCLESVVDVVDEIIIVDTGSVDRTKEIAAKFTDKIFVFPWIDDFAAARNFAFSKGTGEYFLWMDADDVFPASEKRKFFDMKEELEQDPADVVMMVYDAGFDEARQANFSYYRERLIRNCPQAKWQGRVHEVIVPFGKIIRKDIHFEHRKEVTEYSGRNLRIYEKMIAEGRKLDAREQFYYGRECYYHGKYEKAAEVFESFLKEPAAWMENKLEAVRFLSYSLQALGKAEKAFDVLLQGLRLAPPTGEICCDLGRYFYEREEWENAVFWYENALHAEKRAEKGAFVQEECYGYLPCIQLCVCYDRLGDWERAKMYNEMAGVLNPKSEAVRNNRGYFLEKERSSFIQE
ncbi:MAG: glycosyltransferase family 2 protein [Anaerotignum sp.]|nr:glycosyltransferase family 2 protein [Anaerotignum sp.]